MELIRRVALVAATALSVWLALGANPQHLVAVRNLDPAEEQRHLGGAYLDAEEQRLRGLTLQSFTAQLMAQAAPAGDQECAAFLTQNARASSLGGGDLRRRTSSERLAANPYIFHARNELPPGCLADLSGQGEQLILATGDPALPLAEARIFATGPENFHLGSGYQGYPAPPARLLYPWRRWSLALLGLGLVLYALPPRRKRAATEARYATSRVVLGDVLGLMLFALFFALPPLVAGASQAAWHAGLPLLVIAWPLSCLGLAILLLCARHASFGVALEPEGIRIFKMLGSVHLPFAAIQDVLVQEKRPPAWLRRGLWLAAAAGHNPTAAGMAMLQSSAAPLILRINLKDGGSERIWLTDQTGTPILRNVDALVAHLRGAGVCGVEGLAGKVIQEVPYETLFRHNSL